ncbi:RluA family pseudouridine synthase [Aeromicrobium stalagmiti]|uniref:RluA family pseudouridine synthase n=1 Tax=Aeromicrobium stalagmiti TaxID=2738988 RepID=UPI0015690901|nr:RluA family pseudouridine synthase [Aeromicrobium stalagmiti]NRQ50984.1 RluA family pseudouridine synthase [Aeromicrobium stalagmiti]
MTTDGTDLGQPALDHKVIQVPEGLAGERVDSALARLLGLSRTRASELVADGHVTLDGAAPAKSDRVVPGSILEASIPAPRTAVVVATEVEGMKIVFQDDDIVVVDKPVGVAAHPSVGWSGPTVLDHLAGVGIRISTSGAPERQGIVHRLDVGTSGLMAVAKSEHAYTVLKQAFRDRTVEKTYHALVQGHPDPHTGTIDAPIARHPKHDFKFTVKDGGRDSITHYDTLEAHRFASLLTIKLETGRTHQIRVHMSAIHHPCVGDLMYGADPTLAKRVDLDRQWLHAKGLAFTHPRTGEWVEFSSEYPDDLVHALEVVRTIDDNPLPR